MDNIGDDDLDGEQNGRRPSPEDQNLATRSNKKERKDGEEFTGTQLLPEDDNMESEEDEEDLDQAEDSEEEDDDCENEIRVEKIEKGLFNIVIEEEEKHKKL
ncbi:hypothetical protein PIB30_037692 [Stylosanthes scabra]|uniref:Uncharacterized protein n=1 Tax=Stylosanthes scabra TaxID=79078 RepID=A0ABU6XBU6_9FABA|nr:hypothetical protein [Stylosanthes scabra]